MSALPVPRLSDHLDTEIAPSDDEGGQEAKRQKSEPTTPISTSSRPPNEYDEVMGITQVDSREAERFEEGLESEFHDPVEEPPNIPTDVPNLGRGSSFSHGGCGSSSLPECLNLLSHAKNNSPAPCHSGVENEKSSNPPQVMSPNVEEERTCGHGQASDSLPEGQLLPNDEPQSRIKEEIKDEEVTPKSETAAVEIKKEPNDQDVDDQDSDALREELQRSRDEFPPHDSEDALGPERVADELRRLVAEHPQVEGSASPCEPQRRSPSSRCSLEKSMDHTHLSGQEDPEVDQCSTQPCG